MASSRDASPSSIVDQNPGGSNSETFDEGDVNTSPSACNTSCAVVSRLGEARLHQLTLRARAVMGALLVFAAAAGDVVCSPSVAEIASEARVSPRTVQRGLRDLEVTGWIATTLRPIAPKLNDTSVYRLLPHGALLDRERSIRAAPLSPSRLSPSRSSYPLTAVGERLEAEGEGLPAGASAAAEVSQEGGASSPGAPQAEPTGPSPRGEASASTVERPGDPLRIAEPPCDPQRIAEPKTPTRIVGVVLGQVGLRELGGDGFESRLVGLARRAGANLRGLVEAVRAVGERRGRAAEAPPAWTRPASEARGYLYASVRNELAFAAPGGRAPCARRGRLHLRDPMREESLSDPGKRVLAHLRTKASLERLARVEPVHRIERFIVEAGLGGRLPEADVLHVVDKVAENEADRIAAEGARPPGLLMSYLVGCLQRARPGEARRARDGGEPRGTGAAGGRRFEVQEGGVTVDTWEW